LCTCHGLVITRGRPAGDPRNHESRTDPPATGGPEICQLRVDDPCGVGRPPSVTSRVSRVRPALAALRVAGRRAWRACTSAESEQASERVLAARLQTTGRKQHCVELRAGSCIVAHPAVSLRLPLFGRSGGHRDLTARGLDQQPGSVNRNRGTQNAGSHCLRHSAIVRRRTRRPRPGRLPSPERAPHHHMPG
jgi:hypothetical protein